MKHAEVASSEFYRLLLRKSVPQLAAPLSGILLKVERDRVIAAQTTINISATVQPEPVAVPAKRLALVGDDPEQVPSIGLPVPCCGGSLPVQWPDRILPPDGLQHLPLREQEGRRLVIQMPHRHHFQEPDRYTAVARKVKERQYLVLVNTFHQ